MCTPEVHQAVAALHDESNALISKDLEGASLSSLNQVTELIKVVGRFSPLALLCSAIQRYSDADSSVENSTVDIIVALQDLKANNIQVDEDEVWKPCIERVFNDAKAAKQYAEAFEILSTDELPGRFSLAQLSAKCRGPFQADTLLKLFGSTLGFFGDQVQFRTLVAAFPDDFVVLGETDYNLQWLKETVATWPCPTLRVWKL